MTTKASNSNTGSYANPVTQGSTNDRFIFLRRILVGNAIFSTLCALILLIDTGPVALFLGWPLLWPLRMIGIGLLPFALFVFQIARQSPLSRWLAWVVVGMDLAWIVSSMAILLLDWPATTTVSGWWTVGVIAEIVATFAILQVLGLRRAGK